MPLSLLSVMLKFLSGAEGVTRTHYFLARFLLGFTAFFIKWAVFLGKCDLLLCAHCAPNALSAHK